MNIARTANWYIIYHDNCVQKKYTFSKLQKWKYLYSLYIYIYIKLSSFNMLSESVILFSVSLHHL